MIQSELTKSSEPGMITSQIIQRIVDSPLVIADLTGMNPNVFYELAIRHAIRRPLVQLIQKGDKIPFDVAGMRTVSVDHKDLDNVDEAKAEIQKQIKAVEGKKPEQIESPISVSIELQALKQSDKPEDRTLAEFVSNVAQLRSEISVLDKRLSDPTTILPPNYLREIMRASSPFMEGRSYMMIEEMRIMVMELKSLASEKEAKIPRAAIERLSDRIDRMMYELYRGLEKG